MLLFLAWEASMRRNLFLILVASAIAGGCAGTAVVATDPYYADDYYYGYGPSVSVSAGYSTYPYYGSYYRPYYGSYYNRPYYGSTYRPYYGGYYNRGYYNRGYTTPRHHGGSRYYGSSYNRPHVSHRGHSSHGHVRHGHSSQGRVSHSHRR